VRIQAPDPQPRGDGEYRTYVNGTAYGRPYGEITLDEGGALTLGGIALDDARRLAAAATRVEQELASAHARMTAPHGRRYVYEGTCQLCGKPEDDGLHADPADPAACAAPGCGHPRDSHWEHSEPGGPRTGCGYLGCKCTAYAAGTEAAR
jgi:hypothetical protein